MDNVEKLMSRFSNLEYVFEKNMPDKLKGLYIDNVVYLNPRQEKNELVGTVAEEIGHYLTSWGNIVELNSTIKFKQEQKARETGYMLSVTPLDVVSCYHEKLDKIWECAEFLGVTEDIFINAIKTYAKKYSHGLKYENYSIYFRENGTVGVCEWFE